MVAKAKTKEVKGGAPKAVSVGSGTPMPLSMAPEIVRRRMRSRMIREQNKLSGAK